ncbi:hypothetical protein GCM10026987_27590 [Belliella aquatica]
MISVEFSTEITVPEASFTCSTLFEEKDIVSIEIDSKMLKTLIEREFWINLIIKYLVCVLFN